MATDTQKVRLPVFYEKASSRNTQKSTALEKLAEYRSQG